MKRKIIISVWSLNDYNTYRKVSDRFESPIVPNAGDNIVLEGVGAMHVVNRIINYTQKEIRVILYCV